jgi:hypothetical protein
VSELLVIVGAAFVGVQLLLAAVVIGVALRTEDGDQRTTAVEILKILWPRRTR